jgi:GT2 family glycosyltransferase
VTESPHSAHPLISVVIPCYRQANFLPQALESVLSQDHPNVEITVVDDGSPDKASAIAAHLPGVRCVRQEHQGLPTARNTGWQLSKGEYVVFLDADDFLLPGALSAGLKCLLKQSHCAFASGDYQYVNANGSFRNKIPQRYVQENHYEALLRDNYIGMCATVIYQKRALEDSGGFDVTLPVCEDYDLYLRIARRHPVCCHRAVIAAYRLHDGNMSANPGIMLKTVLRVLRRQWPHVRQNPARRQAYRAGIRYWQTHYGDALVAAAKQSRSLQAPPQLGSTLLLLARYAPAYAARYSSRALLKVGSQFARAALRSSALGRLTGKRHHRVPRHGCIQFGDLRRLEPISRHFGYDRGTPIDRYYIERFLEQNASDVSGRVLEIGDDSYTRRFGGDRVTLRDVLHVSEHHPGATFIGDLTSAPQLPSNAFDCIILTQTLHLIHDVRAAIATVHRMLKPGGTVLATAPGISQTSADEWAVHWHWSFTRLSLHKLFCECFPEPNVQVEACGNVLAAVSFLHGLSVAELHREELDHRDDQYEFLITLRARKPATP